MKKITYSLLVLSLSFLFFSTNLSAQFGKNKVQYQTFDWKYIESKHFDVYFHQGGEYLAKFAAIEAERALLQIENALNYKLKKRISFIVFNTHNQFQQNNIVFPFLSENVGGVTQLFKNRIVVPYQGDYSQFRHVVHHELVHGVINDMFHGGTLQSSLTQGGFFMPLWLNEGLCEYLSNYGMDTQTDMFMRDITISEKLPELHRISGYASYRVGQTFYWYLEDKYGKEKVADFINRLNIHKNVNVAFKSSFDMDIEEFNKMWEREIKRIYWPDLDKYKSLPEFAKRVTDREKMGNFYNSAPAISPDGESMAFISEDGGVLVVAVMDDINDWKSTRTIVSSFRQQDFEDLNMLAPGISWNPEGTKLAISAKSGGQDAVYITDAKTGAYKKLVFGLKSIESVQWSPDGKRLAFVGSKNERSDIYIYDIDAKELKNQTNDIFSDVSPKWGADSKTIYFISDRGDVISNDVDASDIDMWNYDYKKSDIYKLNIESEEMERLTNDPKNKKSSLAVSSDNSRVLFVSDKNGIGNLYELNQNTNKIRPLTNSLQEITQISLSRDDSKVLFGTQIEAGYDIFRLDYPFERNLDIEELPLTQYKKSESRKDSLMTAVENMESEQEEEDEESELISYGDFSVDFEEQEVVKPNKDVQQPIVRSDTSIKEEFIVKDYKLKFSPDIILGNPGYSTYFGAQGVTTMLFSDELGNHQLFFQANLLIDLKNSNFYGGYSYLADIIDYTVDGFHNAGFVARGFDSLQRFRSYGGSVSAKYPFDLFNRTEFSLTFYNLSKEELAVSGVTPLTRTLIVPEYKFIHDDVLWGYFGPTRGSRYYFKTLASPDIFSDGLGFYTFQTDIRTYYPLNDYMSFAFRASGGASFGTDPQTFYLGGLENWINPRFPNNTLPFYQPEDFAFMNFQTPLRGYTIADISGSKYFLGNAEFRFPLLSALVAGPVPILIQGIMGSFFFDIGAAWDDTFNPVRVVDPLTNKKEFDDLMYSSGLGIRAYLFGLPIRMDIAWAKNYDSWTKPQYLFSLGYDF